MAKRSLLTIFAVYQSAQLYRKFLNTVCMIVIAFSLKVLTISLDLKRILAAPMQYM